MADSAPRVVEAEREEPAGILDAKADALVELIRKSKHVIVCTGAGVSTSAGIADFRGPNGVRTLRAQGKQAQNRKSTLQPIPTPTHMALVELQKPRSGILPLMEGSQVGQYISELHGNSNREYCQNRGKEYLRDFRAVSTYGKSIHDHRTGRNCALCGGPLLDTVINFGENLPAEPLQHARDHADKADLCLVLGSSLTVSPSDEIPETVGRRRGAKLAICNLQSTPKDRFSDIRIFAKTDELMTRVMSKLGLSILSFILRRRLVVRMETGEDKRQRLVAQGVDVDGTPATFLQSPFIINFRTLPEPGTCLKLELEFMGHYGEPNLEVEFTYGGDGNMETNYLLEYSLSDMNWKVTRLGSPWPDISARTETMQRERVVIDLTED
ncbi:NAD-dependent deacetylase sirtuin-7 [Xylaria sp. FL1042]|nr:NAD-dependent deacetylase sirtuin-7 [Xylaria sp. FL1042]